AAAPVAPVPAAPEGIAFMQLTSGTTQRRPGAIVIEHRAAVENVGALVEQARVDGDHVGYCWLPLYHDMGLVGCLFLALYTQREAFSAPPGPSAGTPLGGLSSIAERRVTCTAGPSFAMRLCVEEARAAGGFAGDLSSLRVLILGGEPIDLAVVDAFVDT